MGKKSRAAKAKGNTGATNASASRGAGVGAVAGTTGHGGAAVTSKKAQKCVRCFGTVKADKGISCPGCSQLYCWRCEKKAFDACPNGDQCVHPIRRCSDCYRGKTLLGTMKEREGFICPDSTEDPEQFEYVADAVLRFTNDVIADDDALTNDATPEVACPCCGMRECLNCFLDPKSANIYGCDKCDSFLCGVCSGKELRNTTDGADAHVRAVVIRCVRATLATGSVSAEDLKDFSQVLRKTSANAIVCCHTPGCMLTSCVSCLDDLSMASMVKSVLSHDRDLGENKLPFQCSCCYWSAKPCANPSCPNEVGVPTKRCGGCHIDRYCSVECQMAVYPAHMNRCNKIQEKRKASLGDKGDQNE